MGAIWSSKDSSWEQDDERSIFKLHRMFGADCSGNPETRVSLAQLLGAKKHPEVRECSASGTHFPPEFSCCPYCSRKLLPSRRDESPKWVPPYGTGDGLKIIRKSLRESALCSRDGTPFPLPSRGGRFLFSVGRFGGEQRLLMAIDRVGGGLWVFNPDSSVWGELSGRVGEDCLPAWSWSAATDNMETGICLPAREGPVWVVVNWATCSLEVDRASGVSIGGAVAVGKYVLAPVLRDDAFAVVYRNDAKGWSDCESLSSPFSVAPQLCRSSSQEAGCGIPVVDEIRNIAYWPLRGGYVRVSGFSGGAPSWEFHPWETDDHPATALIELGPPLWKRGMQPGYWQLCEDRDTSLRDGIVNKLIKFDGDELADSEIVECGQFLTTGQASFAWSEDYWTDVHQRNPRHKKQEDLRFPLLQFGEGGLALVAKILSWDERDESLVFSDFVFSRSEKIRVSVRFAVEGVGTKEIPLYVEGVVLGAGESGSEFRATLSNVGEIRCFIFGTCLHLYLPEDNKCYRWAMMNEEGG